MKLFTPFGTRVLVKIEKEEVGGGLVIPEAHERSLELAIGEVIEIGDDCTFCTIGMRVLLSKYAGIEVQITDENYRVMHEEDIAGEFHEQAISTKTEESLK